METRAKPIPWPVAPARTPAETLGLWRGLSLAWPLWDVGQRHFEDVSGHGLHGVWSSTTAASQWIAGDHGPGLRFANSNQRVHLPDPPTNILDGGSELSAEVLFRPTTLAAATIYGLVGKYRPSTGLRSWRFYIDNLNLVLQVSSDGTAFESQVATAGLSAGTLYHAIFTYKAGIFRVYLNGAALSTDGDFGSQLSIYGGGEELLLCQRTTSGGSVAEVLAADVFGVRVWKRALSAEEARQLYQAPFLMYEEPDPFPLPVAIHAGSSAAGPWSLAGEVDAGVGELVIPDLVNGVSYDIQAFTVDLTGNVSSGSAIVAATPVAAASVARDARATLVGRQRPPIMQRRIRS